MNNIKGSENAEFESDGISHTKIIIDTKLIPVVSNKRSLFRFVRVGNTKICMTPIITTKSYKFQLHIPQVLFKISRDDLLENKRKKNSS
jgi:hypothetical protein